MSATPARQAALRVLRHVRTGALADQALNRELAGLPAGARGWTVELVRGTLRLRGRLDHVIAGFSRRPLDSLDGDVLDTLRLATYQLLEMDGVPSYAAVSQAVDMARPTGAARFVNGVLRALLRGRDQVRFPDFETDPVDWLSTWGSHPRWLVERWVARFGADRARRLAEVNNERPPLYLRPVTIPLDAALTRLRNAGMAAAPVAGAPNALRIEGSIDIESAFAAVPAIVQDPAAGRVADFADPGDGVVLDLCAAPGGKAIALAAGDGTSRASRQHLVAADLSLSRIGRLLENVRRLSLPVELVVADGRRPPFRPADAVLLDAPCTGTGTLRRHADARWRIGPADLAALVTLQSELLDAAATVVRPGGLLIYATCSIEEEENDGQVGAFLDRHPGFEAERGTRIGEAETDGAGVDADGRLRLWPDVHGFDGAFAVRLRRRR